jgi:hypothetical protein
MKKRHESFIFFEMAIGAFAPGTAVIHPGCFFPDASLGIFGVIRGFWICADHGGHHLDHFENNFSEKSRG